MIPRSHDAKQERTVESVVSNKDGCGHMTKAQRNRGDFKQIEKTRETYRAHRTYI